MYNMFIFEKNAVWAEYGGSWIPQENSIRVWDPVDKEWCITDISYYLYLYKFARLF